MAAPSEPTTGGILSRLQTFTPSLPAFALYAAVAAALLLWMPTATGPACPVRSVTGFKCPGCGALRASHAVLHGQLDEAWSYNPALVATLVMLPLGAAWLHRGRRSLPPAAYAVRVRAIVWAVLLLLAAWTAARNLWRIDTA